MYLSKKRPEAHKNPVKVTETKYELWILDPLFLGEIEKRDGLWHTEDGSSFKVCMDALDYLAQQRANAAAPLLNEIEKKYKALLAENKKKNAALQKAGLVPSLSVASKRVHARKGKKTQPASLNDVAEQFPELRDLIQQELSKQLQALTAGQSQSTGRARKK